MYVYIYIYTYNKVPPSVIPNGFVASHALGHMMNGYYTLLVLMNQRVKPLILCSLLSLLSTLWFFGVPELIKVL